MTKQKISKSQQQQKHMNRNSYHKIHDNRVMQIAELKKSFRLEFYSLFVLEIVFCGLAYKNCTYFTGCYYYYYYYHLGSDSNTLTNATTLPNGILSIMLLLLSLIFYLKFLIHHTCSKIKYGYIVKCVNTCPN